VRILFVGDEGEYDKAIIEREDDTPFSLFFCPALSGDIDQTRFDAMLVPSLRFLASPPAARIIPLIVTGPAEIAAECFDSGCQDFIREPWTAGELLARAAYHSRKRLSLGSNDVAIVGKTLTGPSGSVELSDDAYGILLLLNGNRGRPVPRSAIAATIGSDAAIGRSIDMRISRLRATLRSVGAVDIARALRCDQGGYRLFA
jgi:DNA-binding response OmpR family regulator